MRSYESFWRNLLPVWFVTCGVKDEIEKHGDRLSVMMSNNTDFLFLISVWKCKFLLLNWTSIFRVKKRDPWPLGSPFVSRELGCPARCCRRKCYLGGGPDDRNHSGKKERNDNPLRRAMAMTETSAEITAKGMGCFLCWRRWCDRACVLNCFQD